MKRLTIRGARTRYSHVTEYEDGTIQLSPRELIHPDEISKQTLQMMDRAMDHLKKGDLDVVGFWLKKKIREIPPKLPKMPDLMNLDMISGKNVYDPIVVIVYLPKNVEIQRFHFMAHTRVCW